MNLVEIHEEISELLDKQVIVQIEYLSWGSRKPPEKCAMKIKEEEEKNKTTGRLIIILMTEGLYKALAEKRLDGSR